MIYSRSAEYAIRAFVFLAEVPEGKFAMPNEIAEESAIPAHFLAKILQQLVRQAFLRSSKGPTGGFALRCAASDITILQLVEAIDGLDGYQRCIGGMTECNDQMRCGMHDSWKALRSRIIEYLEGTTVEDLAQALDLKRRASDKSKRARRAPGKAASKRL